MGWVERSQQLVRDYNLSRWTTSEPSTIRDLVQAINETGLDTLFVVDRSGVLRASVTDGDVRRALLAGGSLDSPASKALNFNFTSVPSSTVGEAPSRRLGQAEVGDIPEVDSAGRLVCVLPGRRSPAEAKRSNRVVIMAGGRGLRLRPLTHDKPKPMIEIGGKPILEHIIGKLVAEGFLNITISLNYLGEQIENHFRDGERYGASISYIREPQEMGTAGSLALIESPISAPIVVMNGDLLLGERISQMVDYHVQKNALITVGAKVLDTTIPFGVLSTDQGLVTEIVEKPTYTDLVNAGVYVLDPRVIENISSSQRTDMPEVVSQNISAGPVCAFPLHEAWVDLGRFSDLERAEQLLTGQ